jgi:hypothetical protein
MDLRSVIITLILNNIYLIQEKGKKTNNTKGIEQRGVRLRHNSKYFPQENVILMAITMTKRMVVMCTGLLTYR